MTLHPWFWLWYALSFTNDEIKCILYGHHHLRGYWILYQNSCWRYALKNCCLFWRILLTCHYQMKIFQIAVVTPVALWSRVATMQSLARLLWKTGMCLNLSLDNEILSFATNHSFLWLLGEDGFPRATGLFYRDNKDIFWFEPVGCNYTGQYKLSLDPIQFNPDYKPCQ